MKFFVVLIIGGALGVLVTIGANRFQADSSALESDDSKPLYWVAPMDPNYRRDEPGKSPMGMDLVPVYADDAESESNEHTVTIAPEVINNLGVRTDLVTVRTLHTTINTVGYVGYDQDRLIHVHPRVEGWIEKLYLKSAGDPVTKGQALYALYSPQLVTAQEELILALNRNNLRLVSAAEDRLRALLLSDAFIAQLKKSKEVRQTIVFRSTQDGVIDNLNIREGFFVNPSTTLMSIGNLEQVWVEAEIFERQSSLVKTGQAVTMTLDYLPGEKREGKVDYVYPTLDPKTRTTRIRLKFSNAERTLKPNMFAQVTIHVDSEQPLLMVPREAVIRMGEEDRVVLALDEGRFKSIRVNLGKMDDQYIEVKSGLVAGDRVVTSAQFLLDSESSKNSDFLRLESPNEALVEGVVNSLDFDNSRVNISRGPIEKWNRPAATMDFALASTIRRDQLIPGESIQFRFLAENGEFTIFHIEDQK